MSRVNRESFVILAPSRVGQWRSAIPIQAAIFAVIEVVADNRIDPDTGFSD